MTEDHVSSLCCCKSVCLITIKLISSLFNYNKTNFHLNGRSTMSYFVVIPSYRTLIPIPWLCRSANKSRGIIVFHHWSISKIDLAGLLEYLLSHPSHSNHCSWSTSQSPSTLLKFRLDQLICFPFWLILWTWQDCLNILPSHPQHSNHSFMVDVPITICLLNRPDNLKLFHVSLWLICERGRIASIFCSSESSLTPKLEAQVLHTPIHRAHCTTGWGLGCRWADSRSLWLQVGWSWPATAESPSKPPAPAPRCAGWRQGSCQAEVNKPASA